jgi:hypothetical protein
MAKGSGKRNIEQWRSPGQPGRRLKSLWKVQARSIAIIATDRGNPTFITK